MAALSNEIGDFLERSSQTCPSDILSVVLHLDRSAVGGGKSFFTR